MRKHLAILPLIATLMLGSLLMFNTSLNTYAIGEVTPTPDTGDTTPVEPTTAPQPTATPIPPTAVPTQAPQPTAVPETDNEPSAFDTGELLDEALEDVENSNWQSVINKTDLILSEEENDEAYFLRSVAYGQLGRFNLAEADITSAIELAPHQYVYFNFRANINTQLDDDMNALFDYSRAIEIYPLYEQAYVNRSQLNYALGDPTAGDVDDLIARGLERRGIGDARSATEFYNQAIVTSTDNAQTAIAHYLLADAAFAQQDSDTAIEELTNAIDANPELHNSYLFRGIIYREGGDIEAAGIDFDQRINTLGNEFIDETTSIGDTLTLRMNYRRVFRITFDGNAGDVISISADDSPETAVDPLIALLAPDGTPIAGDDDFGGGLNSLISDFELPETGTYTLLLGHAEGGYTFGFDGDVIVSIEAE